jgi:transcriptional regulator with XRE-family HTH domain
MSTMRPKLTNPKLLAFGQQVKSFRVLAELTQEQLAEAAELDRSYIGGLERGERNLTLLNLLTVAKALKIKPAQLLLVYDSL